MASIADLRRKIVTLAIAAGEAHIPSALSILDLLHVLYTRSITENDSVILSKGHGCLALYVVLNEVGIISDEVLNSFCKEGSPLQGHPERNPELGIIATTGSLGHGGPMSVGVALAKEIKKQPGRVFCLVGDQNDI